MSATPRAESTLRSLQPAVAELVVKTIKGLAMDAVEAANSGHPGMPMGCADLATVLWTEFHTHDPADPTWFNRDRFVLSAGHGSMLLYALLHLTGYELPLDELRNFRQWGSKTAGHPEFGHTPGVDVTTGPLGSGFAAGVGMAMAERFLADRYNREFIVGDSDGKLGALHWPMMSVMKKHKAVRLSNRAGNDAQLHCLISGQLGYIDGREAKADAHRISVAVVVGVEGEEISEDAVWLKAL
jgi:transketolase N-terminal domain/subunit